MSEEFATKKDLTDLRVELFGNYPRRNKEDIGRIGELEKSVQELPSKVFGHWKGIAGFVVLIGTFVLSIYKAFAG